MYGHLSRRPVTVKSQIVTGPRRIWREVDLPDGVDGYVRVVEGGGDEVALMVTSTSLDPEQRARVRRDMVAELARRSRQ